MNLYEALEKYNRVRLPDWHEKNFFTILYDGVRYAGTDRIKDSLDQDAPMHRVHLNDNSWEEWKPPSVSPNTCEIKDRIKYELYTKDIGLFARVFFRIFEMNEAFRNPNGDDCSTYEYTAKNGLKIHSISHPSLGTDRIYLRGDVGDTDTKELLLSFNTLEEAQEYCDKVKEAIKDWAENWEGFASTVGVEFDPTNHAVYSIESLEEAAAEHLTIKNELEQDNERLIQENQQLKEEVKTLENVVYKDDKLDIYR